MGIGSETFGSGQRVRRGLLGSAARGVASCVLPAALLAFPAAAFAQAAATAAPGAATQEVAAGAAADTPNVGEIVVTGSQVSRPGFVSATPITTVNAADLTRVSAINVADALNELPALKSSVTPSSVGNLSKLAGGNYLDLRGLGYLRTLTLIDGKRYVPTTTEGVVNTNLVPQALIGSVDVVTGGASAAYGSDAVAGVVNFKLDNKLEGFRGSIQGGITDHNDHRNYLASGAYGMSFGEGRGHLLIGAEAAQNSGIKDATRRKWAGNRSLIIDPTKSDAAGDTFFAHVDDARASYASQGGLIDSGVLRGTKFDRGGGTSAFTYGSLLTDENTMNGGDGDALASPYVLETPLKRWSAYGGANYDFTNALTGYASFSYAHSSFNERSIPSDDTFTIQADNAYLPASVKTALAAAGETSFDLGRGSEDYGVGRIVQRAHTWQATAGLKGKIAGPWTFDASYAYGRTSTLTLFTGDVIKSRRLLAIDAVTNPANGQIVCRSTLTDPNNGCVPLNLFGEGSPSQAAIDYITGTSVRDWRIRQQVADLTIRGTAFDTWAGPVSVAIGGEWRRLNVAVTSDPISAAPNVTLFRVGNVKPFTAYEDVKEAFAEAVVPLASGQSWAKSIDIDIAGRVTDYRTSGTVETWKAGLNYAVNDAIRFRATRSRDIRAPNINELFLAGQTLIGTITDTKAGATYAINETTGGNPFLKPEKADTFTIGTVLTPAFLPRFSLSVDYYDIKVTGAIASLGAQTIVTRCNGGDAASCQLITRGSDGRIASLLLAPVNFQTLRTKGLDVEVAYRIPLGGAAIDLHGLVTYIHKLDLIGLDGDVTRFAGNTDQPALDGPGGTPHWKADASATFSTDRLRASVTGRYVGGGVITNDDVILDYNHVNGRVYVDFSAEYALFRFANGGKIALFGTILNAFDRDPPFTGYEFQTARQLYDVIGRQYTAGLRVNF